MQNPFSADVPLPNSGNDSIMCKSFPIFWVQSLYVLSVSRSRCPATLFLSRLISGKVLEVVPKSHTAKWSGNYRNGTHDIIAVAHLLFKRYRPFGEWLRSSCHASLSYGLCHLHPLPYSFVDWGTEAVPDHLFPPNLPLGEQTLAGVGMFYQTRSDGHSLGAAAHGKHCLHIWWKRLRHFLSTPGRDIYSPTMEASVPIVPRPEIEDVGVDSLYCQNSWRNRTHVDARQALIASIADTKVCAAAQRCQLQSDPTHNSETAVYTSQEGLTPPKQHNQHLYCNPRSGTALEEAYMFLQ